MGNAESESVGVISKFLMEIYAGEKQGMRAHIHCRKAMETLGAGCGDGFNGEGRRATSITISPITTQRG